MLHEIEQMKYYELKLTLINRGIHDEEINEEVHSK